MGGGGGKKRKRKKKKKREDKKKWRTVGLGASFAESYWVKGREEGGHCQRSGVKGRSDARKKNETDEEEP